MSLSQDARTPFMDGAQTPEETRAFKDDGRTPEELRTEYRNEMSTAPPTFCRAAGSGPPMVYPVPMNQGGIFDNKHEYFSPIFSSSLPLAWSELQERIDNINADLSEAYPRWQRLLPCILVVCGFVMFPIGGILTVAMNNDQGSNIIALVLIIVGFLIFASGGLSSVICQACGSKHILARLETHLEDLNDMQRYKDQGVRFDLHDTYNLVEYSRSAGGDPQHQHGIRLQHGSHHTRQTGWMFVRKYTLTVQSRGDGDYLIPTPSAVADALQDAPTRPATAGPTKVERAIEASLEAPSFEREISETTAAAIACMESEEVRPRCFICGTRTDSPLRLRCVECPHVACSLACLHQLSDKWVDIKFELLQMDEELQVSDLAITVSPEGDAPAHAACDPAITVSPEGDAPAHAACDPVITEAPERNAPTPGALPTNLGSMDLDAAP